MVAGIVLTLYSYPVSQSLLAPTLPLTSGCGYLLTLRFYNSGFHDFELPELGLKLELGFQELSLLILASIVLLLQGTESGLQLLVLWWAGCG